MLDCLFYFVFFKCCIGGDYGYLVNDVSVEILWLFDKSWFKCVIGVYLSQQNNIFELVCVVIESVFGIIFGEIGIVCQEEGFVWLDV